MREILLLGGYGRLGSQCVRELLETTRAHIVIAGPSVQRAERVALACGERATGTYVDAIDSRTVRELIPSASVVVACCPKPPLAAIERAISARVPFISLTPIDIGAAGTQALAERAWDAQVPLILQAGASPGLAGIVADLLVRRFERLHELRIASTGRDPGRPLDARGLVDEIRLARPSLASLRRLGELETWEFPEPVGRRLVAPARALDLDGFEATHCIGRLVYLECETGLVARGIERVRRRTRLQGFTLVAEAVASEGDDVPAARICISAPHVAIAAAVMAGALVRAVLGRRVPAGLLTPREALNPGLLLDVLGKRGLMIDRQPRGQ